MENNIEEDIKDLEKYIKFANNSENFSHDTDWNWHKEIAKKIQNILADYKLLQEEFQQVDHECSRLEQKEIKLEKENARLKEMHYREAVLSMWLGDEE